jgi:hypothetical protein
VEILGVSKKTSTKYDTLGCVFDEILFFNFPNIGRHELREASIKVTSRQLCGDARVSNVACFLLW